MRLRRKSIKRLKFWFGNFIRASRERMSELLIETNGSVRTLTLNRPEKRNALNDALVAEMKVALKDAGGDESLRAIVIRGAGKDFCSGADLESLRKISEASYDENLEDAR